MKNGLLRLLSAALLIAFSATQAFSYGSGTVVALKGGTTSTRNFNQYVYATDSLRVSAAISYCASSGYVQVGPGLEAVTWPTPPAGVVVVRLMTLDGTSGEASSSSGDFTVGDSLIVKGDARFEKQVTLGDKLIGTQPYIRGYYPGVGNQYLFELDGTDAPRIFRIKTEYGTDPVFLTTGSAPYGVRHWRDSTMVDVTDTTLMRLDRKRVRVWGQMIVDDSLRVNNVAEFGACVVARGKAIVEDSVRVVGGFYLAQKAAVASASSIAAPNGNFFTVTGTTTVTTIVAAAQDAGRILYIRVPSALQFTDGSNLKLAGNFVGNGAGDDDFLVLMGDGTNWIETNRSVN
jgi:hypothetical protein